MSKCKGCKSEKISKELNEILSEIFVGTDIRNIRLAACYACEYYLADSGQCSECGCYIQAKTANVSESCPLPEPKW
jgi:hypothetical protein